MIRQYLCSFCDKWSLITGFFVCFLLFSKGEMLMVYFRFDKSISMTDQIDLDACTTKAIRLALIALIKKKQVLQLSQNWETSGIIHFMQ